VSDVTWRRTRHTKVCGNVSRLRGKGGFSLQLINSFRSKESKLLYICIIQLEWPSPEYITYSHLCIVGLISSFFQIVLARDIGRWLLNSDWGMLRAGSDVFLGCDSSRFFCVHGYFLKSWILFQSCYHVQTTTIYIFLGKPICLGTRIINYSLHFKL